MKEKRESILAENPSATIGDVGKTVGAMWNALSAAEKKPYEDMAAKDKKRYEAEVKAAKVRGGEGGLFGVAGSARVLWEPVGLL
jgi:hypothetical protein